MEEDMKMKNNNQVPWEKSLYYVLASAYAPKAPARGWGWLRDWWSVLRLRRRTEKTAK